MSVCCQMGNENSNIFKTILSILSNVERCKQFVYQDIDSLMTFQVHSYVSKVNIQIEYAKISKLVGH